MTLLDGASTVSSAKLIQCQIKHVTDLEPTDNNLLAASNAPLLCLLVFLSVPGALHWFLVT